MQRRSDRDSSKARPETSSAAASRIGSRGPTETAPQSLQPRSVTRPVIENQAIPRRVRRKMRTLSRMAATSSESDSAKRVVAITGAVPKGKGQTPTPTIHPDELKDTYYTVTV